VDDFDAAMEELRKRGIEFLAPPTNVQGNRLVFFHDGDGNLVHLIHRPQPLP
jgi:catechol 2,3-dioxygenase-like lactoylglutathione lyase family enzyme